MSHRIDDAFGYHLTWNLVCDRRLAAGRAGSHLKRKLGHDEIHRLINQFKYRASIHLIGRDRFGYFGAVEMRALDLGTWQEPLRHFSEQQDSGIGWYVVIQQVQVREQGSCIRRFAQRKAAGGAGVSDKSFHLCAVQIAGLRCGAWCRVERSVEQQPVFLQILNQGCVHRRKQAGRLGEPAADQLWRSALDQGAHFWMFRFIVRTFHVNQAQLARFAGAVEFTLGRCSAFAVVKAVFVPEQANVQIASRYLAQVNVIRAPVRGR